MASDVIKPVKLLAEWDAPDVPPVPVEVHYSEGGEQKCIVVPTFMPIRFDKIVVSICDEVLPTVEFGSAGFNTPRNAARSVFYAGRAWWQAQSAPRKLGGPVLDVRSVEPNNVAHLMTDIVPRYLLAKKVLGKEVTLLLRREPVGSFAQLLALFGITPVIDTGRVQCSLVRLRGMRGLSVVELFENFDNYGLNVYPEAFRAMEFPSDLGLERIFLARRAPRDLENQAAIEEVTRRYGYKTIYMEDYTIPQQLGIGANAKHVIAIHGAAMSFLAGNKGLGSVVEFFPPNVHHELFATMFGPVTEHYHQIVPTLDMQVQLSGWPAVLSFKNKRFAVEPAVLADVLAKIHGVA